MLDPIGTQCTLQTCSTIDFLPIRCLACAQPFCRAHAQPDQHACVSSSSIPAPSSTADAPMREARTCGVEGCSDAVLLAPLSDGGAGATCLRCKGGFCIAHRLPTLHTCQPLTGTSTSPTQTRAQQLLAKHFPTPSSSSSKPSKPRPKPAAPPTDPAKLKQYRAVQLMKMRHSAVPADERDGNAKAGVGVGERVHLRVRVRDGKREEEKVVWFRKGIVTGRALDLLAARFKLSHDPGSADPSRALHLIRPCASADSGIGDVLPLSKPLDAQVEDGGDLILMRGS